jgi:glucose/arabinose dehydrogenase
MRAAPIPTLLAGALLAAAGCNGQAPPAATPTNAASASGGTQTETSAAPAAEPAISFPPARVITVRRGFRPEVYASGLDHPTALAFGPDARLYATQEGGNVVAVRPRSRRPVVVARGFRTPLGLTWQGRTLYVSSQGALSALELDAGALRDRRTLVSGLPFGLHQQDSVVFARDGRLYFGSGSTCNACREEDPRSATVLSVRSDGSDLRVVASGLRNPYGLALEPSTGRLFASVNGRDDLGDDEPADSVVVIRPGRNFGWPDCWPSYGERRLVGDCAGVTPPLAYLEPHSSADGIAFWRGGLYVALWGQYYASAHGRYVVRVDPRSGRATTFARGFDHPLGVAVDERGALLVADYGRGVVYRFASR